jgi:dTDP-4-dehydrorhamnose reductase
MKVLITGAGGQLGRELLASAPADAQIDAIGRAHVDLSQPEAIYMRIIESRPDLVINTAAYTAVDQAESDESSARAINVDAVAAMAQAVSATGGKLVQISTDFVFDGASPRAYRPHDVTSPVSVYGRTKAEGEKAAGADALIMRTSWLYTAGSTNFVRTMLRLMRAGDELRVVADQIGSPTWAPGLATVLWAIASRNANGIFHHSDAGIASWYDFAVAVQEEALALGLLEREVPIRPVASGEFPSAARRPAFSKLDCSSTRALLQDDHVHWRSNLRRMLCEERALG